MTMQPTSAAAEAEEEGEMAATQDTGGGWAVTVHDPERRARWARVMGTTTLPVRSPRPQDAAWTDGHRERVYLLDLDALTWAQHAALVAWYAAQTDLPLHEIAEELETLGAPVRAADCTVTRRAPAAAAPREAAR